MCEPLSVAVHACCTGVNAEKNVVILGAGPISLLTLLTAKAFGAPRLLIIDIDDSRLAMAKKLGAHVCRRISSMLEDLDAEAAEIKKEMGSKIQVSIDCSGFNKTLETAFKVTANGGLVCLVGMSQNKMSLHISYAAAREVDLIGVFRYKNTWPLCIELISSGKVDVKPLITHRFGFSQKEVEEAFETSGQGKNEIKVMFKLQISRGMME